MRYDTPVKTKQETPFERFTKAMDGLMSVPHSEIKKVLDREKRQRERKKRAKSPPALDRVSGDKG